MNPIKPSLKTELLPALIVLLTLISSFYFYANFPPTVPTHWNAAGEIDQYSPRAVGAFMIPALVLGMYLTFIFLPYLDPKKERYAQFRQVYHIFKNSLIAFMALIYLVASLNALGFAIPVAVWIPAIVGMLFVILGNYFGKIKPNWFMGIRTPWTLSSEEVWNKTHRLGGKAFMACGLVLMLMPVLPLAWRVPLFLAAVIAVTIGTTAYSYYLYRQEEKAKSRTKGQDRT